MKEWLCSTNGKAVIGFSIWIAFSLMLIILQDVIRARKKPSQKEIATVKNNILQLKEKLNSSESIKLLGGNISPRAKKVLLFVLIGLCTALLVAGGAITYAASNNNLRVTLLTMGAFAIPFWILPIFMFVRGARPNTIDHIILNRITVELKLLDKHGQMQKDEQAVVYELRNVDVRYKIETSSSGNDVNHTTQIYHYIYITHNGKRSAYYIMLPKIASERVKSFVIYANLLKENININNLSDDEIRQVIQRCAKK